MYLTRPSPACGAFSHLSSICLFPRVCIRVSSQHLMRLFAQPRNLFFSLFSSLSPRSSLSLLFFLFLFTIPFSSPVSPPAVFSLSQEHSPLSFPSVRPLFLSFSSSPHLFFCANLISLTLLLLYHPFNLRSTGSLPSSWVIRAPTARPLYSCELHNREFAQVARGLGPWRG